MYWKSSIAVLGLVSFSVFAHHEVERTALPKLEIKVNELQSNNDELKDKLSIVETKKNGYVDQVNTLTSSLQTRNDQLKAANVLLKQAHLPLISDTPLNK